MTKKVLRSKGGQTTIWLRTSYDYIAFSACLEFLEKAEKPESTKPFSLILFPKQIIFTSARIFPT